MAGVLIREAAGWKRPGLRRAAFVDPPESVAEVQSWVGPSFDVLPQAPGDLGRRLSAAFDWAFSEGAQRAAAVGTDCLDVDGGLLSEAFDALSSSDAVIGPAVDGGYYLIGLARSKPALLEKGFRDVPWSTERVREVTLARLREAASSVRVLRELRDLDTPEDLRVLLPRWGSVLGVKG